MKTDRFTRAVAVTLAGLLFLLAAGLPATAGGFRLGRVKITYESPSKALAVAVALQVGEVRKRFDENRRVLRAVEGTDGKPAYLQQEVAALIARTGEDLDQAIEKAQPSGTEPLRAWAAAEIERIRREIAPPAVPTASFPGLSVPRAVAVVASLEGPGLALLASAKPPRPKTAPPKSKSAPPKPDPPKPAPPKPATIPVKTSARILDEVAEVVERIFVLADHDDLEVELWVGSTPKPKAAFSFWSQGKIKGDAPAANVIQAGKRKRVLRGLYAYRATLGAWPVTESIVYPAPAGAPVAQESERLDLVKGSRFFCCQFNEAYCHHVDNEKDCR